MNTANHTAPSHGATSPLPANKYLADDRPGNTALKNGEADHRSFLLLSAPRSGSNLLRDCLNQHESIRCFGEIFKNRSFNRKQWQRLSGASAELTPELKHLHETDLVSFWKMILAKYRLDKPVIGAKMFYHHSEGEEIWHYLASSRTPIIHLVREELIDSYLSLTLAEASWIWRQEKDAKMDVEYNHNVSIDLHRFEQYCRKLRRYFDSTEVLFRDNPYLKITYAALVNDREQTMPEVYSFLGLPNRETWPRLTKQLARSREEVVTNWSEVASFIKTNEDLCVVH